MKKLLSLLTISTLTASVPAPLLANTSLTRVKRDVSPLTSNSNNEYLPIKQINNINHNILSLAVDSKDNIYFGTNNGAYVLKHGETTPSKINGISDTVICILIDNFNNVYFGAGKNVYKLAVGSDTPTKIKGIKNEYVLSIVINYINNVIYIASNFNFYYLNNGETTANILDINFMETINSISVNKNDDLIIGTKKDAYILKKGTKTPTKINGIKGNIRNITFSIQNDIYFSIDSDLFLLKQGSDTPTKIDGINEYMTSFTLSSNGNIYIGTKKDAFILQTALSWVKTQSKFALVDSSKTQTWTRSDLIAVDGEVNIDIANPNIDKVMFDNVEQPQTSKQWKINVKPEITAKDHNLQVMFTLDGKQYTSEIIVSMQTKIDPPTPSVKENLSDVIKFGDENNLGNIVDNNDSTIETKIQQLNSRIIDFSQIEITKKDNHSATLTAKSDSKSYTGSVDVKYNVVPKTVVDLKIDVTPTSSKATVVKDYLGQIDTSNITNPVNTFYYANSESVITMIKPTASSVINGVVYGCDDKWNKKSQSSNIDPTSGIKLDGSQLATKDGKYVVELSDNLGHTNNVYLQIGPKQKISNYFDTDNGKQFEIWAKANGYDNIRGYGASQLNKLFEESKNWQQIASDSQFATAVADWFKVNGKLSSKEPLTKEQVIAQLHKQIPSNITIDGINTSNFDVNKVSFVLNQSEFNPNDKVNITVKYNNEKSTQFTLQIKDSKAPDNSGGDSKLWIIGVVVGVLAFVGISYLLFKRFIFDKYIYPKIISRRHHKIVEQVRKEEAEKDKQNNGGQE